MRQVKKITSRKKIAILFLISTTVLIVVFSYQKHREAQDLIQDGNKHEQTGNFSNALRSYKEAEKTWPFYKFNKSFQQKITSSTNSLENQVAIAVFMKTDTAEQQEQQLINQIQSFPGVKKTKLITKEESFKIYQERNKDRPILLESVSKDFFPDTINIYLNDWSAQNQVADSLSENQYVERVIRASF